MKNYLKLACKGSITLLLILFSVNGYAFEWEQIKECEGEACANLAEEYAKLAEDSRNNAVFYGIQAETYKQLSQYYSDQKAMSPLNIALSRMRTYRYSADREKITADEAERLAGFYRNLAGIEETDTCGEIEDQAQGEIEDPVVN